MILKEGTSGNEITLIAIGSLSMVSINGFPSTGYAETEILRVIRI